MNNIIKWYLKEKWINIQKKKLDPVVILKSLREIQKTAKIKEEIWVNHEKILFEERTECLQKQFA